MKFFHLSDLHLGKRVNGFPMLDDQKYILERITELIDREQPDAVIIAGDVYDKSIPPVEAVNMFDDFLASLAARKLQVFIISGNHDSAERVSYGGRVMEQSGIHISRRITGSAGGVIVPVRLEDACGPVYVYLFPYIHPSVVREAWPDDKVTTWTEAMETLIRHANIDPDARNIAVAHQFITAAGVRPEECDSEQKHIGGLDNVEYSVFDAFDYVALGHLHGPQRIGRDTIRYAGSPLKYSFSEEKQKKSVTVVNLKEKGQVEISQIPLEAKRDLRTVTGTFEELMSPAFTASLSAEDYYRVILRDEYDIDQALSRLRARFYKNLMELKYDNKRTGAAARGIDPGEEVLEKEPIEVLGELYEKQNGTAMSGFQKELAAKLIGEIWGDL